MTNFAIVMDRLFHQRFTLASKCGIAIFSLLVFYCFWNKMPIVGLCLVIIVVVIIERVMHTTYLFESKDDDELLIICRGRFSRNVVVPVNEIIKCTSMKTSFGLSHYILVEYGAGHLVSVQPINEQAFMAEIKMRHERMDKLKG